MKMLVICAALVFGGAGIASAQCGPNGCAVRPARQVVQNVVQGVTVPVQNIVRTVAAPVYNFAQNRQVVRFTRQYRRTLFGVRVFSVPVYSSCP